MRIVRPFLRTSVYVLIWVHLRASYIFRRMLETGDLLLQEVLKAKQKMPAAGVGVGWPHAHTPACSWVACVGTGAARGRMGALFHSLFTGWDSDRKKKDGAR